MRTLFAAVALVLGVAVQAAESTTILLPEADEIQLALEAGPEHVRADAAVYVFGKEGYRRVREGRNGVVCFVNRDGNQNGDNTLKPTCWDAEGARTIVPVMLRVGEMLARSVSAAEIKRDIDAGFLAGRFSSPAKAGIAYMLRGDIQFDPASQRITKSVFPPHYMIYAPGVSNADIGVAGAKRDASQFALPAVYGGYSGGSRTAYIIVPAAPGPAGHTH